MAADETTAPLLRRLLPSGNADHPGVSTYHSRFGIRNVPGRVIRTGSPVQGGAAAKDPGVVVQAISAPRKTKAIGKSPQGRRAVCIYKDGRTEYTTLRRHMLTSDLQLRHRDLRALDPTVAVPYPSAIFVRSNAWVINLEGLKAIVSQDTLLIISVPLLDNLLLRQAPTLEQPAVQYLSNQLNLLLNEWGEIIGTGPSSDTGPGSLAAGPSYQDFTVFGLTTDDASRPSNGITHHADIANYSQETTPLAGAVTAQQIGDHNLPQARSLEDLQRGPGPPEVSRSLVGSSSAWERDVLRALHSLEDAAAEAQPFQLRAIEACLCLMTHVVEQEVSMVERLAYPLLHALRQRISRNNLEAMHDLQNTLSKLVSRVSRLKEVLEDLLDEEVELTGEDKKAPALSNRTSEHLLDGTTQRLHSMAEALDLASPLQKDSLSSRDKLRASSGRDKSESISSEHDDDDELEEVLEAYWLQTDGLLSRVQQLRDRISHTELLLNLDLDSRRNALVTLSLVMDLIFVFLEGHMVVSSVFGANVWTGFEEETEYGLWPMIIMVLVGTCVGFGLSFSFGIFAKMRGLLSIPDFSFSGGPPRTPARV